MSAPRDADFRTFITPIKHPRFDWRVSVTRLSDGVTKTDRASGGWTTAEAVAMRLQTDLTVRPVAQKEDTCPHDSSRSKFDCCACALDEVERREKAQKGGDHETR